MAEIRRPGEFSFLESITSIDGRFRGRAENLSEYFSEYATIKGRVFVETEYIIGLLDAIERPLSGSQKEKVRAIAEDFDIDDAMAVWEIDERINHDTKAVEYFLQEGFKKIGLEEYINFIHLGLTSTDVDNTALALSINRFKEEVFVPSVDAVIATLTSMAEEQSDLVMLARTHGQPAVPTTAGKELANFAERLKVQKEKVEDIKIGSKIAGAVGNHNALVAAYPDVNWVEFSRDFLNSLGLEPYKMTTQVEPYDHKVEFMQAVQRTNMVIQSLSEDIWRYLSLGYLSMRDEEGHVGSSTMPQKINPIGFEFAESYVISSNGILGTMIAHLPANRLQRDLTDKYMLRDLGQALAMSILAHESANQALQKIGFNEGVINKELDEHWEVISEGVQTILRVAGHPNPYEKVKKLTRGKKITKRSFEKFIDKLAVEEQYKRRLRDLSPQTYTGEASNLARIRNHARNKKE